MSETHFDPRRCLPMSREEEHRCAVESVKTSDPVLAERLIVIAGTSALSAVSS
jgi:hypothetical protein